MDKITIIRSNRKTICVEISKDLKITVRAPLKMQSESIQRFINDKKGWIDKTLKKMRDKKIEKEKNALPKLSDKELKEMCDLSLKIIPVKTERYAKIINVTYRKITIRNQRTRWGSCTANGNLNFNCLLMLCPEQVVDYIIIHELCHRKFMDHSKYFWQEVAKYCPNYKTYRAWLKSSGQQIIERIK